MAEKEDKAKGAGADKAAKPEKAKKAEKSAEAPAKTEKAEKPKKEAGAEAPAAEAPAAEKPVKVKSEKALAAEAKGKKAKEEAAQAAAAAAAESKAEKKPAGEALPTPPARLLERYKAEIRPKLRTKFGYKNDVAVPKVVKIVVSMGVGAAIQNPKRLEEAQKHLTQIAGQKAVTTKARVSVANFKLREGQGIGCKVTLRRQRMFEFLDRLISVAIPRIRDFRGFSPKGFDGRGNYSMGLTEQVVFPEVDADRMEFTQGMNIAICTNAKSDKEAFELLAGFGFPFRT